MMVRGLFPPSTAGMRTVVVVCSKLVVRLSLKGTPWGFVALLPFFAPVGHGFFRRRFRSVVVAVFSELYTSWGNRGEG